MSFSLELPLRRFVTLYSLVRVAPELPATGIGGKDIDTAFVDREPIDIATTVAALPHCRTRSAQLDGDDVPLDRRHPG